MLVLSVDVLSGSWARRCNLLMCTVRDAAPSLISYVGVGSLDGFDLPSLLPWFQLPCSQNSQPDTVVKIYGLALVIILRFWQ